MNREYRFRGMTMAGEWVYGLLAVVPDGLRNLNPGSYISNSKGSPFAYHVRPETVGLWTGLKDKEGNPIHEGDILKIRTPYRSSQIHCGRNIPTGRYEEPLEPAIKEEYMVVSFHEGCFVIGEPSLGDLLCWRFGEYDRQQMIEAFDSVDWEGEDGDLAYLLDNYKFANEQDMLNSLGTTVAGNLYEHPHLIQKQ